MASLERLEIYLENSVDGMFSAGEVVYGKLVVVLGRSMKIQGVEMKIRGRGHAEWRETSGDVERQLYETEEYLKHSVIVFGKASTRVVEAGSQTKELKIILEISSLRMC